MRKKKKPKEIEQKLVWCNAWSCRYLDCPHRYTTIPEKYKNSASRYVPQTTFPTCFREVDKKMKARRRRVSA